MILCEREAVELRGKEVGGNVGEGEKKVQTFPKPFACGEKQTSFTLHKGAAQWNPL